MNCQVTRDQLSAYMDRELSLSESLAIENHLKSCPDCSSALADLRSLSGALSQSRYEAPDSLRHSLEIMTQPKKPAVIWPRMNAWSFGAAFAIVCAFFFGRITSHQSSLGTDLVASHTRSLIGTHLIDVESSDRHTVKPWFIGKIDYSPTPFDLKESGFELKGGRLDYVGGDTVPVYVYQHQKHVINLYVFKGGENLDQADRNGFHLRRWVSGGFTYIAVSDVTADRLQAFESAFEQAEKQ